MAAIAHTSRAEQDLVDIWFEIARQNQQAADRVIDHIRDRCPVITADYFA